MGRNGRARSQARRIGGRRLLGISTKCGKNGCDKEGVRHSCPTASFRLCAEHYGVLLETFIGKKMRSKMLGLITLSPDKWEVAWAVNYNPPILSIMAKDGTYSGMGSYIHSFSLEECYRCECDELGALVYPAP